MATVGVEGLKNNPSFAYISSVVYSVQ